MRWKITAGILLTSAFLIPPASAVAQAQSPKPNNTPCQTIVYEDIRELVSIDLATASDEEVEAVAGDVLAAAVDDSLSGLRSRLEVAMGGTEAELRAFLTTAVKVWFVDLRIAVNRTMVNAAGPKVRAAAQKTLDSSTLDAYVAYLNHDLYLALAADFGSLKLHTDVRGLVSIDLATASDGEVWTLAGKIRSVAVAESLNGVRGRIETAMENGKVADVRAFLQTMLLTVWSVDLRVAVNRTMVNAGPNVREAAQKALDNQTVEGFLTYLNHDLYLARSLDCVYQRAPSA